MSKIITQHELDRAALVLIVGEDGLYEWSSDHSAEEVATHLLKIASAIRGDNLNDTSLPGPFTAYLELDDYVEAFEEESTAACELWPLAWTGDGRCIEVSVVPVRALHMGEEDE